MKRNSTMFITKKSFFGYQSSLLQSIEKSFESTYRNEKPGEKARKSVLQFACSYEVQLTRVMGNVETFVN